MNERDQSHFTHTPPAARASLIIHIHTLRDNLRSLLIQNLARGRLLQRVRSVWRKTERRAKVLVGHKVHTNTHLVCVYICISFFKYNF